MEVPPLPEGCPWSGWALPNVKWCEENLCAWITTPANTWSNVLYMVLGVAMLRASPPGKMRLFGWASIAVGAASFVYHASYTFFFQFFDFVGMFLFAGLPFAFNLVRAGRVQPGKVIPVYAAYVIGCSALLIPFAHFGIPIQSLVGASVLVVITQEILLWRRREPAANHRRWLGAMGLLGAGATCSALDLSRTWCDPHNHWVQGHAAWHVLTALSLYVLFTFYRPLLASASAPAADAQVSLGSARSA